MEFEGAYPKCGSVGACDQSHHGEDKKQKKRKKKKTNPLRATVYRCYIYVGSLSIKSNGTYFDNRLGVGVSSEFVPHTMD